jgi:7-cyano-7-deazaguanine synthase in queuosine biosynthesis
VRGEVDADFLATMEEYMAAWCRWRPDLFRPVAISADVETVPRASTAAGAIMAFSGGLDSTFALHAHKHGLLGRRARDVQAAVLIQGFDVPLEHDVAFDVARGHVQAILESYGVRLNVVRTNWQKPFCIKWGMTHVLGITAVLHLFHRQFGGGVIADDVAYDTQVTPWSSNAITNQMLGCGGFGIRTTGAAWSRTQKAAAVAANPAVLEHLRVCYERPELGGNCGECEKCVRTKLNFYAVGVPSMRTLGRPIALADVRRTIPSHFDFPGSIADVLAYGTWGPGDPIRVEVDEMVRRFNAQAPERGRGVGRRRKKFLQSAKKRTRPLIRAMGSALHALNPARALR